MKNDSSPTSISIPPAAKAASEAAVRTAMAENAVEPMTEEPKELEEGEVDESKPASEAGQAEQRDPNEIVTVFNDKEHFNAIHPLYSPWSVFLFFGNFPPLEHWLSASLSSVGFSGSTVRPRRASPRTGTSLCSK
jgi:hypothetical protein